MAFCIECGAKAPEVAKFCPHCGKALVAPEIIDTPISTVESESDLKDVEKTAAVATAETPKSETPKSTDVNNVSTEASKDANISPLDSLAASANDVVEAPKSKAGLLIGLSLIALLVAGGGAYATGLIGGGTSDAEKTATAPTPEAIDTLVSTELDDGSEQIATTPLSAYQDAIKSGRISDLGKFARSYPKNSLAKDAEAAAFASLQRQSSVLAYSAFTEFFPEADTSSYTGPRSNADILPTATDTVDIDLIPAETVMESTATILAPSIPMIRPSLTARAEALDPFIAQGDTGYALSVVDELLATPDLNESEATYLLNIRAKAETAVGFTAPADVATIEIDPVSEIKTVIVPGVSSAPEISLEPDVPVVTEPTIEAPAVTEPVVEIPAFDTAAKPIERFGAITPDEATKPGECNMTFSINAAGSPTNIIASCTDPLFIAPATDTVSEWVYSPALLAGDPVQQDGLVVTIKFHLDDTE